MELNLKAVLSGVGGFVCGFGISQALLSFVVDTTIVPRWFAVVMAIVGAVITYYFWNRIKIERIIKEEEDPLQ